MAEKKHLSLMSEILIGMIGSIIIVTLFLGLSFSFVIQNIVKKSTINTVSQAMDSLNEEVSGILGEYNNLVIDLSNVIPVIKDDRDEIRSVVKNRDKVCYTEPFTDINTGKIIVTLSYRVLDDNGNLIGVSAADIVLDAISEAVSKFRV